MGISNREIDRHEIGMVPAGGISSCTITEARARWANVESESFLRGLDDL